MQHICSRSPLVIWLFFMKEATQRRTRRMSACVLITFRDVCWCMVPSTTMLPSRLQEYTAGFFVNKTTESPESSSTGPRCVHPQRAVSRRLLKDRTNKIGTKNYFASRQFFRGFSRGLCARPHMRDMHAAATAACSLVILTASIHLTHECMTPKT